MPVPTPRPNVSQLFEELGNCIRKPQKNEGVHSGTNKGTFNEEVLSNINRENHVNYSFSSPIKRSLFSDPSKFSHIQRSLSSLHLAKSHVYSNNFFGQKRFFGEEFDFSKAPLHPRDRRKVRFGLKSIVDFIVQLDLHNLKELLTEPEVRVEQFTDRLTFGENTQFSDDSFFGFLRRVNPEKCRRLHLIVERIISNMHFSQSMSGFLASEDVIEAPKIVVTEAVKRGPDLGSFLRGGSFAACVQVYRNLASKFDSDKAFFINSNSQKSNSTRAYKRFGGRFPYPTGFCYTFQKTNSCTFRGCRFKHVCTNCESKNHGRENCSRPSSTQNNRQQDCKEESR